MARTEVAVGVEATHRQVDSALDQGNQTREEETFAFLQAEHSKFSEQFRRARCLQQVWGMSAFVLCPGRDALSQYLCDSPLLCDNCDPPTQWCSYVF